MKISFKPYRNYLPFLVTSTLLSGIGLIVWFGIIPFQGFITEKADGIQEYYASRENRERQINQLPDLQGQYEDILSHEQTLDILLSENQIVDFVKTLEGLAKETGTHVTIEAKDKDAIEEKKNVPVKKKAADAQDDGDTKKKAPATILDSLPYDRFLHVDVIVKGEYRDIMSFLHKMETLPLGLDVIGLSIRKRDTEEIQSKPDNPGTNPFLILSQGNAAVGEIVPPEDPKKDVIPGSLEATFDTVVYVSK